MEATILDKELDRIDGKIEKLHKQCNKLREERARLCDEYIKQHQLVPEKSFAKAQWLRNGRKYSGVVYVTVNHIYEQDDGTYKVLPNLIKCEPIPADKDDGNGPHYYTEYWEKKRKFVVYDELLSIEPYDAPRQFCGKCIWLHGRKEGDKLLSGCGINLGYKCNGGKGFACDRFIWWNYERKVGMSHYDYMLQQAAECTEQTKDFS